jgi:hypothetical protein
MFYTFRCSNHLFSVVSMRASLVYGYFFGEKIRKLARKKKIRRYKIKRNPGGRACAAYKKKIYFFRALRRAEEKNKVKLYFLRAAQALESEVSSDYSLYFRGTPSFIFFLLFIFSLARNFVPETGILGASSEKKKIAHRRI